ncbi:zinc-ribbon domain-containing protein [Stakelama sp. CBK3Z-3]|uniref:Zinc-ribbon domain-containing protein n=1 Tax=Stakelama flava TaxID=2860338 RepID=A0ABS6XIS8_9SPHN|nr:MJ0042-type zinc finger domain-containing protein [Stakelama flava]MBW4330113.1 zinc-ribbon domain-containing protein [Stakelama flava]
MILECAECHTRYQVPDNAIGPEGRTVRCASCKHSWFQPPPLVTDRVAVPEKRVAAPASAPAPVPAAPASPAPVHRFVDDAVAPRGPGSSVGYDPFAQEPLLRARRNPARRWTAAALLAGIVMLLATGALFYFDAPGIAAQLGLSTGDAQTPLRFSGTKIDRGMLSSGNELFAVSGRIENPSAQRQRVPDIRAELRDDQGDQGRLVYSWTITPPQRTLGPGQNLSFNSAKLDVPAASKTLELSFVGENGQ